jgi:hypothetical protein
MPKTRLERIRDRHNAFANDVIRLTLAEDKLLDKLTRNRLRLAAAKRAVARSQKRVDREAVKFNAPLPKIDNVSHETLSAPVKTSSRRPKAAELDDGIPAILRRKPKAKPVDAIG